MIYEFECQECNKVIEIDVLVSEYYIPECCNKPAKRIYSVNLAIEKLARDRK